MSRNRYARRTDQNQAGIVRQLQTIPGVSVATDHDDLLVGYRGRNYWIELKRPETVSKRTGEVRQSKKRETQKRLELNWTGHYAICWTFEQVAEEIGVI